MHITQYEVYSRWLHKWTPQIVYGASAVGAVGAGVASPVEREPTQLSSLPGGQIVRAF